MPDADVQNAKTKPLKSRRRGGNGRYRDSYEDQSKSCETALHGAVGKSVAKQSVTEVWAKPAEGLSSESHKKKVRSIIPDLLRLAATTMVVQHHTKLIEFDNSILGNLSTSIFLALSAFLNQKSWSTNAHVLRTLWRKFLREIPMVLLGVGLWWHVMLPDGWSWLLFRRSGLYASRFFDEALVCAESISHIGILAELFYPPIYTSIPVPLDWSPCNSWLIRMDFHLFIMVGLLTFSQSLFGHRFRFALELILSATCAQQLFAHGGPPKSTIRAFACSWLVHSALRAACLLERPPWFFTVAALAAGLAAALSGFLRDDVGLTWQMIVRDWLCMTQGVLALMRLGSPVVRDCPLRGCGGYLLRALRTACAHLAPLSLGVIVIHRQLAYGAWHMADASFSTDSGETWETAMPRHWRLPAFSLLLVATFAAAWLADRLVTEPIVQLGDMIAAALRWSLPRRFVSHAVAAACGGQQQSREGASG